MLRESSLQLETNVLDYLGLKENQQGVLLHSIQHQKLLGNEQFR
jgi:hypothetical protein